MKAILAMAVAGGVMAAFLQPPAAAGQETPALPYYFFNFEAADGFPAGTLAPSTQGLQVMEPEAAIVTNPDGQPAQHLITTGAVVLVGERFTADDTTHLEVWVRPRAVPAAEGGEFLDFDGAAVALFVSPEGRAMIHGFHAGAGDRGFWISSGIELPVTGSVCTSWHRINIAQHWKRGVWDLSVDGLVALSGLLRGSAASGSSFEAWMYGQSTGANAFDDLIVSAVHPDALPAAQRAAARAAPHPKPAAAAKVATLKGSEAQRRQYTLPQPDVGAAGKARLLHMKVQVVGGGRHLATFDTKDDAGAKHGIVLYSPGYDEDGKPKPLEVELRCDAVLEEGASLEQIEWAISEESANTEGHARLVLKGNFAAGPTLIAVVPSESSNKALEVSARLRLIKK